MDALIRRPLPPMVKSIAPPHQLAPGAIVASSDGEGVLEACNMSAMIGVLQQIGYLATYSHEVFSDLASEVDRGVQRIGSLKGRLQRVTERLGRVDDALGAANDDELTDICATNPGKEYWAGKVEDSGLFLPNTRPTGLQTAFEEARPPPSLDLLDPFVDRSANPGKYAKYGYGETCASNYSDPYFFVKQWLDEEEAKRKVLKAERKARREERRGRQGNVPTMVVQKKAKRVQKKRFMTFEEEIGLVATPRRDSAHPPPPSVPAPPPPRPKHPMPPPPPSQPAGGAPPPPQSAAMPQPPRPVPPLSAADGVDRSRGPSVAAPPPPSLPTPVPPVPPLPQQGSSQSVLPPPPSPMSSLPAPPLPVAPPAPKPAVPVAPPSLSRASAAGGSAEYVNPSMPAPPPPPPMSSAPSAPGLAPPPLQHAQSSGGLPPPPPPLPHAASSMEPPPAPPLMQQQSSIDSRGDLLAMIRGMQGGEMPDSPRAPPPAPPPALPPAPPAPPMMQQQSSGADSRGDLLAAIRGGTTLKKARPARPATHLPTQLAHLLVTSAGAEHGQRARQRS